MTHRSVFKILLSPLEAEPLSNEAVSNVHAEADEERAEADEEPVEVPVTAAVPIVKNEKVATKPWAKATVAEAQGEPDML